MHVIRDFVSCTEAHKHAALAIGNFDGFHPGHQAIIAAAKGQAETLSGPLAAMTFTPHPRTFFNPAHKPLSIYPFRTKARLLSEAGVEMIYALRFNAALAALPAEAFVKTILVDQLQVRHVVTGDAFIFGHKRAGNADLLAALAEKYGFGYTRLAPLLDDKGLAYSSTRIREALKKGDIPAANALLSRPYAIEGHVRHGDARGRQLGFPTANIGLEHIMKPAFGVYAVRVRLPDGTVKPGVANLGTRPTINDEPVALLEVHCFDTNAYLYGQRLHVELRAYLREERKFDNLEVLKMQIAQDCMQARAYANSI